MAGALAERDFVEKLKRAGFLDIEIVDRRSFGIDDAALYPLFTPDLIEVMKRTIPSHRQPNIATSVVIRANLAPEQTSVSTTSGAMMLADR